MMNVDRMFVDISVQCRFKPVKGWLTSELTEKIEGWSTKVYEASGKMVAVTHLKTDWQIPSGASFEEYLGMNVTEDVVVEMPVNLSSMGNKAAGKDVRLPLSYKKGTLLALIS